MKATVSAIENGENAGAAALVVLIPVFNDWESVATLIGRLDAVLVGRPAGVLIVDDGSTVARPNDVLLSPHSRLSVDVLALRGNLGHQRAIAVGLAFLESASDCKAVVVMDGDGEDAPEDVARLLDAYDLSDASTVIFAERMKRSESFVFQLGYIAYRIFHRLLTGLTVRVGNFSVIPREALSRLVVSSDLWNHYAAAVIRARLPTGFVPTARCKRIADTSRMDFFALVAHGISAMAVFGDRVAVRLLVAAAGLVAVLAAFGLALGIGASVGWYVSSPWSSVIASVFVAAVLQLMALLSIFVFMVFGNRDQNTFVPVRDYVWFVSDLRPWRVAS